VINVTIRHSVGGRSFGLALLLVLYSRYRSKKVFEPKFSDARVNGPQVSWCEQVLLETVMASKPDDYLVT